MANGGWYGTQDEWERLEAPLIAFDSAISNFAAARPVSLTKNSKDWPERSLRWHQNPSCLMQLYLADEREVTWNLWLCCAQDRGGDRYWRQELLIEGEPAASFADNLTSLLGAGYDRLNSWQAQPELFEFATKLATPRA